MSQQVLKVSPSTDAKRLAAALSHVLYDGHEPVLRAVGASAVNQACKAVVIAGGLVSSRAIVLNTRMGFEKISGNDDDEISALIIRVIAG